MDSTKKAMINAWPDNILIINRDGKIIEVSNRLCRWLLWLKTDLIGRPVHDLLCAPARFFKHSIENCPLNNTYTNEDPFELSSIREGEALVVDKEGKYHHVEYVKEEFSYLDSAASIIRFVDNSKLQHTVNELKRMSYFVDESPFPLVEFSEMGTMEFINPKMTELILRYGYDDNGNMVLIPKNLSSLLKKVVESKNSIDDIEIKTEDGQYWSWFFYYVISKGEKAIHAIASNITARKKNEIMEQELRHYSEQIKENTRREDLAKLIHEFRSPLNAVVGFAAILENKLADRLNEDEANFLKMIEEGGRNLADQISESLDGAKDNRLANKLEVNVFDSYEILNSITQQLMPLAIQKNLNLTMTCLLYTSPSPRDS